MKKTIENINKLQNEITELNEKLIELNEKAFNQLCEIIQDVCKCDDSIKKVGKNMYIIHSSSLINSPWSVEYHVNEVSGKILIESLTKIFSKRGRVSDVIDYLKSLVKNAKGNIVYVKTVLKTPYLDAHVYVETNSTTPIKKSLVEKIITMIEK